MIKFCMWIFSLLSEKNKNFLPPPNWWRKWRKTRKQPAGCGTLLQPILSNGDGIHIPGERLNMAFKRKMYENKKISLTNHRPHGTLLIGAWARSSAGRAL